MQKNILILMFLFASCQLVAQNDLQRMIDDTPDGGIVSISEGKYIIEEPLIIEDRNGLTLRGEGDCNILLTDVWKDVLVVNNSNSIRIEGLYMSHVNPLKEYQCNGGVISLNNTNKVVIENCELEGSGTIGVQGSNIFNLEVAHCYIHDNTFNAFYFFKANNVVIHQCVIENNANLIQSYKLDGFEMSDNLIQNNGGYWRKSEGKPGLKAKN